MGATISLSVEDRFRLGMRLAQSPEKVARVLNKTMLGIAVDMERQAKKEVPVRTGRLQSSIYMIRENLRYTIQPDTVYAEWVHEGSKGIHIPASHMNSSYDGNPFMTRAFEIVEPGAHSEIDNCVKEIIQSI